MSDSAPKFKVGDRVLAEGRAGTVTKAFKDNSYWVIRDGKCVELPFSQSQLQLLSIDDQITAAQAEVDRLRALKRELDKPKVGDIYKTGTSRARVEFIGRHFVILQEVSGTNEWCQSFDSLRRNWSRW